MTAQFDKKIQINKDAFDPLSTPLEGASQLRATEAQAAITLFEHVIQLTGLPQEALRKEMTRSLAELKQSPDSLDLESLRALVASYVQDVLVGLKDDFENEV